MSTPVITPAATAAVEYPSSDGKPMAESDAQALGNGVCHGRVGDLVCGP